MRATYATESTFCYRGVTHRYFLRNRNTPDCEASFQISKQLWDTFCVQSGAALRRIKTAVDIFETGFGWRRVYLKGAVKRPLLLRALFYLLNKFFLRNDEPVPPKTASYRVKLVRGVVVGYDYPVLEVVRPKPVDPSSAVAALRARFCK
jgi:hypothetical protein